MTLNFWLNEKVGARDEEGTELGWKWKLACQYLFGYDRAFDAETNFWFELEFWNDF